MAGARKPHPADVANANTVAAAVRFEIALFLGAGRYATDTAETLNEAHAKAVRLAALHPNDRRPLIYGVTAEGRSGLVTDALSIKENPMKTPAKKANARRGKTAKAEAAPRKQRKARKIANKIDADSARPLGKRAAIDAAAREGKLPAAPDFSAPTHARFRNKLASVVELAKAGDLTGLRGFEINPVSSSPKAIARYRDLCVIALEAQAAR
jgi:hypothetical protein